MTEPHKRANARALSRVNIRVAGRNIKTIKKERSKSSMTGQQAAENRRLPTRSHVRARKGIVTNLRSTVGLSTEIDARHE